MKLNDFDLFASCKFLIWILDIYSNPIRFEIVLVIAPTTRVKTMMQICDMNTFKMKTI